MPESRIVRSRAFLPTKSAAAFAVAIVAVIVIAVIAYRSLEERQRAAEAMNAATDIREVAYQVGTILTDAETGQRGYLLAQAEHYLEPYERAKNETSFAIAKLTSMVQRAEQRDRVELLPSLVESKLAELAESIALERSGQHAKAIDLVRSDRGKLAMDRIRALLGEIITSEQLQIDRYTTEWEASVRTSSTIMLAGAVVLLLVMILVGMFASRDFRAVEAEGWIRRVQLALNTALAGDFSVESVGDKILATMQDALSADVGAVYIVETNGSLRRVAGHALGASAPVRIDAGVGLTGQVLEDNRAMHLRTIPADYLPIGSGLGATAPRELLIVPAAIDASVQAVIELGFLRALDATEVAAIARVADAVAIAIRTARDRRKLEELLEETQRQAEELAAQQEELRVTNEELEQQSRSLQVSQVQLENQQAEVEQINAQLEEQAQSLERQRDDLARAGSELQRSNEYKSQFLANMSHELRTPLNSSLILAKLLSDNKSGNLTPEQIKFAQTIYSAGNDLLVLINDILDLSKIEAGMLDVRPEPISIARLADDLDGMFVPMAKQKKLAFTIERTGKLPPTFETDSTRLMQIVKNLVSNALKFTETGGVTLAIDVSEGSLVFAVRDTGIGIAPDQLELIFQPFRQADGAINRRFGGTGLGLSISRDLAKLLGGDLAVTSTVGRGSTFTLRLPLVRAIAPARPAIALPVHAPAVADKLPAGPIPDDRATIEPHSRTLLVVEDDLAFARVLFDLAHELEFLALVADNAADGLALARRFQPSAIVLDVGLPDRSGLAVLDSLKRDPKTRHIPVHVVSGNDHTRTALEMGAAGYALKPIARDQLVEAIKRLESKFTQRMRRVLIVEDDPVLRDSTALLLGGDDVETVTAGTTTDALAKLRETTFDCMVLDLALPDRSGLELLEEMAREHGDYPFPPVIVYTGRSLSTEQIHELGRFSSSIIIKGARSPERLLDEVTLFLHQVESKMPPERQRMLRDVRDREAVFEGKRVLVVEDDVRNIFALSSVLEPRGATVSIARNGKEALAAIAEHPDIDLVLMDVMMPEMDGLEAMRRIRAQPALASLPIIALTAKAMIDDRDKCIAAGANDYIAKPLDVDKLVSLARVWIRK